MHHRTETAMASSLSDLFNRIGKRVLAELEQWGSAPHVDHLFDAADWLGPLLAAAGPQLERAALLGAWWERRAFLGRQRARKGHSRTKARRPANLERLRARLPADVVAAIREHVRQSLAQPHWNGILAGVRDELAQAISEGLLAGEAGRTLAARVRRTLGPQANAARALRIARTETTGALNSGAQVQREQLAALGAITGKVWQALDDEATRPSHAAAHGQTVAVDGLFVVGGEQAPHPGHWSLSPGQRINCRCCVLSVLPD